jgi:dihydrodipicolinate synthase/N-acetylneuraminate lyase
LVDIAPEMSIDMLKEPKEGSRELVQTAWTKKAPLARLRAKNYDGINVVVIKEGMNLIGLSTVQVREPLRACSKTALLGAGIAAANRSWLIGTRNCLVGACVQSSG